MKLKITSLMKAGVPTVTGRVYTKKILQKATESMQSKINDKFRSAFGMPFSQVGSSLIYLSEVSHKVSSMELDGDSLNVEIEVLDTPNGKVLKELIESNCSVRFGLSGVGSIEKGEVLDDYSCISVNYAPGDPNESQKIEQVKEDD